MSGDRTYSLAELSKLVNNLLRLGVISQVDTDNARVRVTTGDLETNWIPWLTQRAGENSEWNPPEVDEQVLLLSPCGDLAQAVALPSIYSDAKPAKSTSPTKFRQDFKNGDFIEHDTESGQLTIKAKKFRFYGPVEQTGGDMTSDGVSAQHHITEGVVPGTGESGEPKK